MNYSFKILLYSIFDTLFKKSFSFHNVGKHEKIMLTIQAIEVYNHYSTDRLLLPGLWTEALNKS